MASNDLGGAPDLTACDREPITKLNRIQPFGFLVFFSNDWTVASISANAGLFFGVDADKLIGTAFTTLVDDQALHTIRNRMAILYSTGSERLYGVKLLKGKKRKFDLALHYVDDGLVLEGEPSQEEGGLEAASMVRAMIARLNGIADLGRFHADAARQVRAITGFDRVMIYRFDENGAGEVVAESVSLGTDSFLGLRFPATDIPVQARALYLRNPFRIIADVGAEPVPLLPDGSAAVRAVDLISYVSGYRFHDHE